MGRPLAIIEAELTAAKEGAARLQRAVLALLAERKALRRGRELAVLADFDAGVPRLALARKHGISPNTLASIMFRNGRRYRKAATPITHLPAEQQRAYHKAKRCGMGPEAARAFAVSVTA